MTRILFADGEAIEPDDFNLARELNLKMIFDQIIGNMAGPDQVPWDIGTGGRRTSELRPLGHAGAFLNGGTNMDINGGAWVQIDYGGTFGDDAPIATFANKPEITYLPGFVAASSGMWRRDLIQARIVSTDDATELRDFEDGVTRNLTDSAVTKRSRLTVEYSRKAGAEVASQALADDPTNEAVADVGWHKIGSVLHNDVSAQPDENNWDWRKPWGYSQAYTTPGDFYRDIFTPLSGAGDHVPGETGYLTLADCPFQSNQGRAGTLWGAIRMERVTLMADFVANPIASGVRFTHRDLLNGFLDHHSDVGLLVGTTKAEATIYNQANSKPLWSNGGSNPLSLNRDVLQMRITTPSTSDKLYGARWLGWGGF